MNWLLLVIIVILIYYAWRGKNRGFLRTVFTIFSTFLAIILTLWISPYATKWVQNNDKVMNYVNQGVYAIIMPDSTGNKTSDEVEYIGNLSIPYLLKETLIENKTPDVYSALAVKSFKEYVSNFISLILINIGTFFLIYLLVKILLNFLSTTLDLVSNLPVISGINRVSGLIAGAVNGIIVVWIGLIIITLFANNETGYNLLTLINESEILSSIYNNNVILILLTDISKVLFL